MCSDDIKTQQKRPVGRVYFLAAQVIFYHWLMKGLYPTYKQNSQDLKRIEKKTGVFDNFTQPILEFASRFSGFSAYFRIPLQKNREFYFTTIKMNQYYPL